MGDLNGDPNTKLERAMQIGKANTHMNNLWYGMGYFIVGIEAGNQVFLPSVAEGAEGWKNRGPWLGCDMLHDNGRPLGSDWTLSVYRISQTPTVNNIPAVGTAV